MHILGCTRLRRRPSPRGRREENSRRANSRRRGRRRWWSRLVRTSFGRRESAKTRQGADKTALNSSSRSSNAAAAALPLIQLRERADNARARSWWCLINFRSERARARATLYLRHTRDIAIPHGNEYARDIIIVFGARARARKRKRKRKREVSRDRWSLQTRRLTLDIHA